MRRRSPQPSILSILAARLVLVAIAGISAMVATGNVAVVFGADQSSAKVTLYGEIDELSYLCSSAGLKLSGGKLPGKVMKISLGSAAAYSGLRPGDTVLDLRANDNNVIVTVERGGRKYQASIATDVRGLRSEFDGRKVPFSFGDSPFDPELKRLAKYDVVVLLDRSASMGDQHAGCPGDLSKWMWCKQQLDNLYLATSRVLENGFQLVLFNRTYEIKKDVTLWDLKQVFQRIQPAGEQKNIAAPLEAVLHDYFYQRAKSQKPCIIVVLTDGKENLGRPLQDVLIEASQKLNRQGEVTVTFMQVGDSLHAEELFDDLERNLIAKGAKYKVATYKPFTEVRNKGLLWLLLTSAKGG